MSEFDLQHSNGIYIPHFSPSTITSFISYKGSFYNNKVKRSPFVGNPNMARGTAVEHAVNKWLEGEEVCNLCDFALDKYDDEIDAWKVAIKKEYVEADDEIRASIPKLVECAYQHFSDLFGPFNKPSSQEFIECHLEGVNRKIIGYLDYRIKEQKRVLDCKVVARTPSKLSLAYIIQGSIYRWATDDSTVSFEFIVANKKPVGKTITLTDEQYVYGLSYAKVAARIIEELETCEDPKRVMQIMTFPDLDAIWDIGQKREAAKEWGIFLP